MYKNIFSGAISKDDNSFLMEKCDMNDIKMIDSIVKTNEYLNNKSLCGTKVGFITMKKVIDEIGKHIYKTMSRNYFDKMKNLYNFDELQINSIERIIESKNCNDEYVNINLDILMEKKGCPHCNALNIAPIGTTYIVCGVDIMGKKSINDFSMNNACLNDWCFVCGKRLCKHWYKDELYIAKNRKHNGECCRRHAEINGFRYPDDYCQCYLEQNLML